MARLIDADKLVHSICRKCNDVNYDEPCEPSDCAFYFAVQNAPTVDAVPVVRCKGCRFIIDRADGTHGCYRHFVDDCNHDDFCSYGERKTNEAD